MAEQSGLPDIFKQSNAKQKVVKHITVYNQSDVHIKLIATERNTKKEENHQEIAIDINATSDPHNDANKDAKLEGITQEHALSQSNDTHTTEQHLFMAPQTSEVLTYHGSMIRISIYHQHDGKWINDCENARCDANYYVFQRNAQNQLEFVQCPDELKRTQKGEIAVPSKEELNYKVISEWNEQMVMMFIATICDGKYYKYKECFDALTGNDVLKMNQKSDITRDIKYDSMVEDPSELNEIWMK
eukprot:1116012_1